MTTPEPANQPTPAADAAGDPSEDLSGIDPDSPGAAATKPLDDPSRGDAEPNEPA